MALTESTKVSIPLSAIVGALVACILFFGGWMWRLQEQIFDIKQDVAVIKATVAPMSSKVARNP